MCGGWRTTWLTWGSVITSWHPVASLKFSSKVHLSPPIIHSKKICVRVGDGGYSIAMGGTEMCCHVALDGSDIGSFRNAGRLWARLNFHGFADR